MTAATDTLQAFRYEPFYQGALETVLRRARGSLPPSRAAELAGRSASQPVVALIVRDWVETDPAGASGWVLSQTDAAARESGVVAIVNHWIGSDPDAGVGWVSGIQDEALRKRMLAMICSRTGRCAGAI
jgi:hypothetical protein